MSECLRHALTGQIETYETLRHVHGGWLDFLIGIGVYQRTPCPATPTPGKTVDQMTEEEQTQYHIFNPLTVPIEEFSLTTLAAGFVVTKYLKDAEGRKQLAGIAEKYLDVVGKTMSSLSAAGGAHPLSSLIHGRITICVYETLGLIQPGMARVMHANFEANINKIIAQGYLSDIIGGIGEIVPG